MPGKLLCETLSLLISLATPHPPPPPKKPVQQAPSPSWFLFLTPTKARATGTLSLLVSFATPLLVLNKMKRFHIGCENPVLVPCFISHSEQCCRLADFVQRGPKNGRTSENFVFFRLFSLILCSKSKKYYTFSGHIDTNNKIFICPNAFKE